MRKRIITVVVCLLAIVGCASTGKAVRIHGECQCTGTGEVLLEAGDTGRLPNAR